MKNPILRVENVAVSFSRRRVESRRLSDFVHEARRGTTLDTFHALDDVTVAVGSGEHVGLIGRNGAGKSTLLRVIAGVIHPQRGQVEIQWGRIVTPLIELGIGFHPDLTGRENCFLGGALLGISEQEMRQRIDGITTFAELEDFIDQPIKTYSSGMYARLAFALATSGQPDILILDEILAVGDQFFVKKSMARMQKLMGAGTTVLMVSHNLDMLITQCSRLIWLDHGRVVMDGPSMEVGRAYRMSQ